MADRNMSNVPSPPDPIIRRVKKNIQALTVILLPPASEGWGKVIFSLCMSVHTSMGVGTPSQVWVGEYPVPGLGGGPPVPGVGGTPSQVWVEGYLIPGLDGGYPSSQVWIVGGTWARSEWWGVPSG